MSAALLLALPFELAIGLSLGLVGGGSILALPVLSTCSASQSGQRPPNRC